VSSIRIPLLLALAAALLVPALLPACGDSEGPTFTEAVEEVYKHCDADTLNFRAASKGMQLAFKPCGSNNFMHFTWSTNGLNLYYQATQGGWVLKDTGENYKLRIGVPRARPAWLTPDMLAYPDASGRKIGVYQVSSHILNLLEIDQVEPEQLARGAEADQLLYMAAETPGGVRDIYRLTVNTAESEKAFGWMDIGVESFTYQPLADAVCYRELGGKDVICARAEDGEEIVRVKDRLRGGISTDGRYVVTEGPGEPVKVFPDGAEDQPSYIPTEIVPPALWILDVQAGEEILWEGVHGTQFEWYSAAPYYGSFLLWGFDGLESNRNVTLIDLRNYMKGQGWEVPLPQRVSL